jgi:hypothetical protein
MAKDNTKIKSVKNNEENKYEEISFLKNPLSTIYTLIALILEQVNNLKNYYIKHKITLTLIIIALLSIVYAPEHIYVNLC